MESFTTPLLTGASTGAILLVAALGLALTFGQMGVINMAHGEFIMAGCYTAYVVQQITAASGMSLLLSLALGFVVGGSTPLGSRVTVDEAGGHLFGVALFNDWSARDIQGWEYQPLGPFLSKNFASTISPWVVTMEALAPVPIG